MSRTTALMLRVELPLPMLFICSNWQVPKVAFDFGGKRYICLHATFKLGHCNGRMNSTKIHFDAGKCIIHKTFKTVG